MQEKNISNVRNIILQLADHLGVSGIKGFAEYTGIPESTLYSWSSRGKIADTGSIVKKIPNVSIGFLETGEGPMLNQHPAAAGLVHPDKLKPPAPDPGAARHGLTIGRPEIADPIMYYGRELDSLDVKILNLIGDMAPEQKRSLIKDIEKEKLFERLLKEQQKNDAA